MPTNSLQYLNGEWTVGDGDDLVETLNPAHPDDVVVSAPAATREQAAEAVATAAEASEEWASTTPDERDSVLYELADLIERDIDEIAETMTREEGKPISSARAETARTAEIFRYFAGDARRATGQTVPSGDPETFTYTVREPLGVVSLITPWNFPVATPGWKIAPALATGNTVVFKPSSVTPLVGRKLVELFDEVGLPDGVVNFVVGPGSTIGDEITTHDDVDGISFTGSNAVGDHIAEVAAEQGTPVQLEMGGKNPQVVLSDADLDAAAEAATAGAYGGTGQACTATSRLLVHEDVLDELRSRVVERAQNMTIGPGLNDPDVSPASHEDQHETNHEYVEIGVTEGAELLCGGNVPEEYDDGYYIEPTVFGDVSPDMRIAQEEIFGPILSLIPVTDYEEAVEIANDIRFGLSASIFTTDMTTARQFVNDVEAGVVKINGTTTGSDIQMPFGGMKASSSETHKELGQRAYSFYTHEKAVYQTGP